MTRVVTVQEFDWYWAGHGVGVDQGVIDAIKWYNGAYSPPANFVQLCRHDVKELTLNGRLQGVKVFERELCGERGNIMVGRLDN